MMFVASYTSFKKMDIQVNKNEKAHYLLVPQKYTAYVFPDGTEKTWTNLSQEEKKRKDDFRKIERTSFQFKKCAFDISQTNAYDHPELLPKILQHQKNDSHPEIFEAIEDLLEEEGVRLKYEDLYSTEGLYSPSYKTIVLNKRFIEENQIPVLLHELAHHILHNESSQLITEEQREIEAEATAKLVANHYGIQTKSNVYIAGYAKNNLNILKETDILKRIQETSNTLIQGIEKKLLEKSYEEEYSFERF